MIYFYTAGESQVLTLLEYKYYALKRSIYAFIYADNGRYLGWRSTPEEPYKWIGYKDADDLIKAIGSAFIEVGLEPRKNEKIGIFARNRPEVK